MAPADAGGPLAGCGLAGRWTEDYPMSTISSWHAGGGAEWLYEPAGVGDLERMLGAVYSVMPVLAIGRGTNLLVRDGGVKGTVVKADSVLNRLETDADSGEVVAGAGVPCPKVAKESVNASLRGGEFLCGIPGTVGGALAMNAGCHGSEIWDVVYRVGIVDMQGRSLELEPSAFDIGYRSVRWTGGEGFLFKSAQLALERGERAEGRTAMSRFMNLRRRTQPLTLPNSGSVFRNPPGDSAGRLVEECGLKGLRIGDAQISEKHANFIVNLGAATAADIEALALRAREQVLEQTGTALELEVRIVGEPQ